MGAPTRGVLSAPKASRFGARVGNTMGLIDFLWLWIGTWWGKRKYCKKSLGRCRREHFPQKKPKSSLLDELLPDESHIKYGLTWGSEKSDSGLHSPPTSQKEDRNNPIYSSKFPTDPALSGNKDANRKALRGKHRASSGSSPTAVPPHAAKSFFNKLVSLRSSIFV